MNKRRSALSIFILIGLSAVGCRFGSDAVSEVETFTDFPSATAAAGQRGIPVLVDFYATWCAPCKVFDEDLETKIVLGEALGDVVFARVDAEAEGMGLELAERYEVQFYPSFVLLNAAGEEIDRWAGYGTAAEFIASLEDATADLDTVIGKQARFDSEPTAALALRLARIAESHHEYLKVISLLEHAAELDPAAAAKQGVRLVRAMGQSFGEPYDASALRAAAEKVFTRSDLTSSEALQVAWTMHKVAKRSELPELRLPFLIEALDRDDLGDGIGEEERYLLNELKIVRALTIDHDEEKAVALKRNGMDEGWLDDASSLNAFAWWCFENRLNLEEAYDLAVQGLEIAEDGAAQAMILDTVAEICNARGDCEGAIEWMDQAIAADPDNKYYQEQRHRFEELLDSTVVM